MKLVNLQGPGTGRGSEAGRGAGRPGIVVGDEVLDLAGAAEAMDEARGLPGSLRLILEGGRETLDRIRRVADRAGDGAALRDRLRASGALAPLADARLLAPIPDPGLLLSCGMNYHEHLREMNTPTPEKPTAFTKNAAQIVGPGAPIVLPARHPDMVDWEGEFTVVIGRHCHNVSAADALDCVAGYTIVNDVSARDWVAPVFKSTGIMGPIHAWEHNLLGKQFPTFCPLGPWIVTADEVGDPGDLKLTTTVNGTLMQSSSTSDLVFGVPRLIEYFSQFYAFRPGDLITTGSPPGVGFGRKPPVFLRAGDTVDVWIERIGTLSNPVAASA
jgi:acylpyruvate hydrolase